MKQKKIFLCDPNLNWKAKEASVWKVLCKKIKETPCKLQRYVNSNGKIFVQISVHNKDFWIKFFFIFMCVELAFCWLNLAQNAALLYDL